jgi:hypothetical protein
MQPNNGMRPKTNSRAFERDLRSFTDDLWSCRIPKRTAGDFRRLQSTPIKK